MVRRRRVGMLLRQYRNAARLTAQQVADELDCSLSKVTRMETAKVPLQRRDVRDMLTMYGVTDEQRQEIVDLLGDDKSPRWWHAYNGLITLKYSNLIALEADAAQLRWYEPQVIPGLLQTESYARSTIRHTRLKAAPRDVETRVEVRMTRQKLLTKEKPVRLIAVLDEAALRRRIGDASLMRAQYERLVEAAELPNVELRVLTFDRPSACTTGPFTLIDFPDPADPTVVYVESAAGDQTVEKPNEVRRFGYVFDDLCANALGVDESVKFIQALIQDER